MVDESSIRSAALFRYRLAAPTAASALTGALSQLLGVFPDTGPRYSLSNAWGVRLTIDPQPQHPSTLGVPLARGELAMSIRRRLDEIKDAMASSPCNWIAACTAWQDVSAEAKGTTLELVVDWLGYCLQLRDLEAVRSGLSAIEEALGDEPLESVRRARGGLSP